MTTNYDEMTEDELETAYTMLFQQRYPDRSLLLRRVLKMNNALRRADFRIAELESFLSAYAIDPQEEPTP